jgi:hypothetical protein
MCVGRKINALSPKLCCRVAAVIITYECVCDLASFPRGTILSPVARLAISYSSTLFHKRHNIREKFTDIKACFYCVYIYLKYHPKKK